MTPYHITMHTKAFGNYDVEVMHDLAWAIIFVNGKEYQCQGNNDGMWLDSFDEKGSTARPLQWVLEMLCFGRDPDSVGTEEKYRFDEWLKGDGGPLVAAWREALARAKFFWEHPADLSEAIQNEVVDRWKREPSLQRKGVLQTFIPEAEHGRLGIDTPAPLR